MDHEPFEIPEIGNYYGGLSLKREGGVDYWSIEDYDGHNWEPCDPRVADALRAAYQPVEINRVEVIHKEAGRVMTMYNVDVEYSLQDEGRTLKISTKNRSA